MLPKAHLTLLSGISGSKWVIIPSWLSGSWRSFLYSSSVYSCHLLLISSASVRSVPFFSLYCAHLCLKYSLGISSFLEEISSLSHSFVVLSFFALITEESILVSPCYSSELCIQVHISFVYSFAFASLLFTAICKVSSDNCFAFLHFFFLGIILIIAPRKRSWTSIHSSSGTLSIRPTIMWLNWIVYTQYMLKV